MSFFGEALTNLYQKADKVKQDAFNAVAKTSKEAIAVLDQGYEYAKEKAVEGYEYAKDKAVKGYEYGKEKAVEGYEYAKDKAVKGYEYGKEKAIQAKDYAAKKTDDAKTYVKQKVIAAKEEAEKVFKPQPAGAAIEDCPLKSKAERVKARKKKIQEGGEKAKDMPPGQNKETLDHAVSRLEQNNTAVERARLAKDTYNVGQGDPPEGWDRVGKDDMDKLGIKTNRFPQFKSDFNPDEYKKGGFYPELYKSRKDVFGEEKYVLSFRGTIPTSLQDWGEGNIKQGVGAESEYYSSAMAIASNIKEATAGKGMQLETTGHSLGGGLATAGGIVADVPFYAFDPAGVHPKTLERSGAFTREQANKLGQNYYAKGEILTFVQNPLTQTLLVGAPITYGAAGPMFKLPVLSNAKEVADATAKGEGIQGMSPGLAGKLKNLVNKVELHDMDYVIAGLEQQKADDLAVIDRNLKQ